MSVMENSDGLQADSQKTSSVVAVSPISAASSISSSPSVVFVQTFKDTGEFQFENQETFDEKKKATNTELDSASFFQRSETHESLSKNLPCLMPPNEQSQCKTTFGLHPNQTSASEPFLLASAPIGNAQPFGTRDFSSALRNPHLVCDNVPKLMPGINSTACSSEGVRSFAETYASLTSWTTKLTTEGCGQIPSPDKESQPLPFLSFSHEHNIPASSTLPYINRNPPIRTSFPLYSKIGPVSHRDDNTNTVIATGVNCSSEGSLSPNTLSSLGLEPSTSPHKSKLKSTSNKEHRFKKTADALQKSGLWEVAMKTGNLIKRNRELQKELEQFRADALLFLKSVIKNPQNRDFIKSVLNNALSTNNTHQKRSSVMNVVVSAAAAASVKSRSSTTRDSGNFSSNSCESQSDQSVSNYPCSNLDTDIPGSSCQTQMEID